MGAHGSPELPTAASDDRALLDWLHHYGVILILVTVLGGALSLLWGSVTTPRAEMWSIVVDTEQLLPARQLGVVAETLFRAEETYRPALTDLGLDWTPEQLFDMVELRSVPESRLLIVAANGDDTYSAAIVSDAMARSLTAAFRESGYPGFEILGAPQPPTVPSTVSLPVFGALGASVGLLCGLGLAVIHFRTRRPVLTIGAAGAVVGPDDVVSVPQWLSGLGALRHVVPTSMSSGATRLARRGLDVEGGTVALRWPGVGPRKVARLATALDLDVDPDADRAVVVVEPGSRRRDLEREAVARTATTTTMLWLA